MMTTRVLGCGGGGGGTGQIHPIHFQGVVLSKKAIFIHFYGFPPIFPPVSCLLYDICDRSAGWR